MFEQLIRALCTHWNLERGVLDSLSSIVLRKITGEVIAEGDIARIVQDRDARLAGRPVLNANFVAVQGVGTYQVVGDTAVIGIGGVIAKHSGLVNNASQPQGTSLDSVRALRRHAQANDDVGSILYRFDSPGGYADGNEQMAQEFFAGRSGGKPEWAYVDGSMQSAAAYLGLQMARVEAARDAFVGSLGTYMIVRDSSKAAEQDGFKFHLIKSSNAPLKGQGSAGIPVSDEAISRWQQQVDDLTAQFHQAVSRGRGLSGEALAAVTDGGSWIAERAKSLGLVDAVRPIGETIADMNSKFPSPRARARARTLSASPTTSLAGNPGRMDTEVSMWRQRLLNGMRLDPNPANRDGGGGGGDQPATESTGRPEVAGKIGGAQLLTAAAALVALAGGDISAASTAVQQAGGGLPKSEQISADQALKANDERIKDIRAAAKGFEKLDGVAALVDKAVGDSAISIEQFRGELLALVSKSQPPVGNIDLSVGASSWEKEQRGHEAILLARFHPHMVSLLAAGGVNANAAAAQIGYQDAAALSAAIRAAEGDGLRRMRLVDIAARCVESGDRIAGRQIRRFRADQEVLAAAFGHGSSDFPALLGNVANKSLLVTFAATPTTYQFWTRQGDLSDFKSADVVSMSNMPSLLLTPEGAPAKEGTLGDRKESIQLATYARKISISRQALINDDLGGIMNAFATWGLIGALVPETLAYQVLNTNPTMAQDSKALFHADHGNLADPAAALSMASLEAGYTAMITRNDFKNSAVPIMVDPKFLLVPNQLKLTARRLTTAATDPTAANANSSTPNVLRGALTDIASPYLSAGSATAWYLVADPTLAPAVQVGFLQGQRTPMLSRVDGDDPMGASYVILFDAAAKALQFEAIRKNAGS
ncbi:MAG: hypothetical protein AMXMBFR58_29600 [Phycisphaerae bacterium]